MEKAYQWLNLGVRGTTLIASGAAAGLAAAPMRQLQVCSLFVGIISPASFGFQPWLQVGGHISLSIFGWLLFWICRIIFFHKNESVLDLYLDGPVFRLGWLLCEKAVLNIHLVYEALGKFLEYQKHYRFLTLFLIVPIGFIFYLAGRWEPAVFDECTLHSWNLASLLPLVLYGAWLVMAAAFLVVFSCPFWL